ncbi:MAG: hypothetical protein LBE38_03300 [Deltaproteobacteria bacterium]|jgi:hypothetical protein|nr:hypothetical protein [Deltaproteobacteria bacterium]
MKKTEKKQLLPTELVRAMMKKDCIQTLLSDLSLYPEECERFFRACKFDYSFFAKKYPKIALTSKSRLEEMQKIAMNEKLLQELIFLWHTAIFKPPFEKARKLRFSNWQQLLFIFLDMLDEKNEQILETDFVLLQLLQSLKFLPKIKSNVPYVPPETQNARDKYIDILKIKQTIEHIIRADFNKLNEEIEVINNKLCSIMSGKHWKYNKKIVAQAYSYGKEMMALIEDLLAKFWQNIDKFESTPNVNLDFLFKVSPEDISKKSDNIVSYWEMVNEQFQQVFEPLERLKETFQVSNSAAYIFLQIRKLVRPGKTDYNTLTQMINKINRLPLDKNWEPECPLGKELIKLLLMTKPLKESQLINLKDKFSSTFITKLNEGAYESILDSLTDELPPLSEELMDLNHESDIVATRTSEIDIVDGDDTITPVESKDVLPLFDGSGSSPNAAITSSDIIELLSRPSDFPKQKMYVNQMGDTLTRLANEDLTDNNYNNEEFLSLLRSDMSDDNLVASTSNLRLLKGDQEFADRNLQQFEEFLIPLKGTLPGQDLPYNVVGDLVRGVTIKLLDKSQTRSAYLLAVATVDNYFASWLMKLLHLGLNFKAAPFTLQQAFIDINEEIDRYKGLRKTTLEPEEAILMYTALLYPNIMAPNPLYKGFYTFFSKFLPKRYSTDLLDSLVQLCDIDTSEDYSRDFRIFCNAQNLKTAHAQLIEKTDDFKLYLDKHYCDYTLATHLWKTVLQKGKLHDILEAAIKGDLSDVETSSIKYIDDESFKKFIEENVDKFTQQAFRNNNGVIVQENINSMLALASQWVDYHRALKGDYLCSTKEFWTNRLKDIIEKSNLLLQNFPEHMNFAEKLFRKVLSSIASQDFLDFVTVGKNQMAPTNDNLSEYRWQNDFYATNYLVDVHSYSVVIKDYSHSNILGVYIPPLPSLLNSFLIPTYTLQDAAEGFLAHLKRDNRIIFPSFFLEAYRPARNYIPKGHSNTLQEFLDSSVDLLLDEMESTLNANKDLLDLYYYSGFLSEYTNSVFCSFNKIHLSILEACRSNKDYSILSNLSIMATSIIPHIDSEVYSFKINILVNIVKLYNDSIKLISPEMRDKVARITVEDNFSDIRACFEELKDFLRQKSRILNTEASIFELNYASEFYAFLNEFDKSGDPFQYYGQKLLEQNSSIDKDGKKLWEQLSQMKSLEETDEKGASLLRRFLSWLGFTVERSAKFIPIYKNINSPHYHIYDINASTSPCLNIWKDTYERLTLIMCWDEKFSSKDLTNILDRYLIEDKPTVILSFTKLSTSDRKFLWQWARNSQKNILVVDTNLVAFLSSKLFKKKIHQVLFKSGFHLGNFNPYIFSALNNRPLFYGRMEVLKKLSTQKGHKLLLGGPFQGKTAILKYLFQSMSSNLPNGEYVTLLNAQDYRDIVGLVRAGMVTLKLADSDDSAQKILDKLEQLQRLSNNDKIIKRITILADNSDEIFRELMANPENKEFLLKTMTLSPFFEIIFTGYTLAGRLNRHPESHLFDLGPPIIMGPFQPLEAMLLVIDPLKSLGFEFKDEKLIYKLLSNSSNQPHLVQLICRELIKEMNKNLAPDSIPPFIITEEILTRVMAKSKITGAFKNSYQVILGQDSFYRLIYTLMSLETALANPFATPHLQLRQDGLTYLYHSIIAECPDNFSDFMDYELEYYLKDMESFGLVNDSGFYFKNSPAAANILWNNNDELFQAVDDLKKLPIIPPDGKNNKRRLYVLPSKNNNIPIPSPLTMLQEYGLIHNTYGNGVRIISCAQEEELTLLKDALFNLVQSTFNNKIITMQLTSIDSAFQIFELSRTSSNEQIFHIIVHPLELEYEHLCPLLFNLCGYVNGHNNQAGHFKNILSILITPEFSIIPKIIQASLQIMQIQVKKFNESSLKLLIDDYELKGVDAKEIMESTGGWYLSVVNKLMKLYAEQHDIDLASSDIHASTTDETNDTTSIIPTDFQFDTKICLPVLKLVALHGPVTSLKLQQLFYHRYGKDFPLPFPDKNDLNTHQYRIQLSRWKINLNISEGRNIYVASAVKTLSDLQLITPIDPFAQPKAYVIDPFVAKAISEQ